MAKTTRRIAYTPEQDERIARVVNQVLRGSPPATQTGQRFDDGKLYLKIIDASPTADPEVGRWIYTVELYRTAMGEKIGDGYAWNLREVENNATRMSGFSITPAEEAECGDIVFVNVAMAGEFHQAIDRWWDADAGRWMHIFDWPNVPVIEGVE